MENNLFDPELLHTLNIDRLLESTLRDKIPKNERVQLHIRPLRSSDYESYVELLRGLTDVGDVSLQSFLKTFNRMFFCPGTYFILVLEHLITNEILAAASLLVEMKFIHSCAKRGHIEDVIVCAKHRSKNFGKLLIEALVKIAKYQGCYKVSLDCKDDKVGFYEKLGFTRMNNMMCIRFDALCDSALVCNNGDARKQSTD